METQSNQRKPEFEKRIEDLPPSAKLVYKVLEYGGFLTQKEIAKESYLPARTVRYALNRLKNEEMLLEKFHFKDARQSLYGLKTIPASHGLGNISSEDNVGVAIAEVF